MVVNNDELLPEVTFDGRKGNRNLNKDLAQVQKGFTTNIKRAVRPELPANVLNDLQRIGESKDQSRNQVSYQTPNILANRTA